MEKLINNNAMKIEGLKKTVDFVCSEVQDLKKTMSDAEKCIDEEKRQKLEGYQALESEVVWSLRKSRSGQQEG